MDPARTSPYAFYQYWVNVADADVMRCIAYLTEIEKAEYDELVSQTESAPGQRAAQKRLAQWMTEFCHGEAGLASAMNATQIFFGGEIGDATDAQLGEIFADVPSKELDRSLLDGEGYWIVQALQDTGLANSSSEARRSIKDGGIYVNNERVSDMNLKLTTSHLASETVIVVRKGKRKYALLRFPHA